jgi:large subunit ribosomal protein L25
MAQETISLSLEPRTIVGKSVKHLRKAGKVPAVIHDHGRPSIIVEGDRVTLLKVYQQAGKHHPISLTTNGVNYTVMIKTAEFEPRKHHLNHMVFNAVAADQMVEAEVPVQPKYSGDNESSPAEKAGLIVLNNIETIEVEALPKNLPDVIYYDGDKLIELGDHIAVADLLVPENVTIKTDLTQAVATVYEPSALAAANDAVGGTEEETETESVESEETEETPSETKTES